MTESQSVHDLKLGLEAAAAWGVDIHEIEVKGKYLADSDVLHSTVSRHSRPDSSGASTYVGLLELLSGEACEVCLPHLADRSGSVIVKAYSQANVESVRDTVEMMAPIPTDRSDRWRLLMMLNTELSKVQMMDEHRKEFNHDYTLMSPLQAKIASRYTELLMLHKAFFEEEAYLNPAKSRPLTALKRAGKRRPRVKAGIMTEAAMGLYAPMLKVFYPPSIPGSSLHRVPLNVLEKLFKNYRDRLASFNFTDAQLDEGAFEVLCLLHQEQPRESLTTLARTAQAV